MPPEPHPRLVVITGGTRGLGRAMAEAFLERGDRVVAVARTAPAPAPAPEKPFSHPDFLFVPADVRSADEIGRAARTAAEKWGPIDVWINDAGYGKLVPFVGDAAEAAAWDDIFDVNFRGTLHGCRAALPLLRRPGGTIVNVASVAGMMAPRRHSAYATAKAAVIALTRSLAVEYAAEGIRVNAVSPGPLDTEGFRAAGGDPAKRAQTIPSRTMVLPAEVASACLFLSEPNSSLTGHNLVIDGGCSAAGCYV